MAARLILIRHAKSDYPWGVVDHDRPLNERGRRDAPEVGAWLEEHIHWLDDAVPSVRVSTARRAQLTWGLASARLSPRWDDVDVSDEPRIYEADVSDLLEVVGESAASTLVLVGHNPGLMELVAGLAVDDALRAEALVKFPTSAIAVMDTDVSLAEAVQGGQPFQVTAFAVPRG